MADVYYGLAGSPVSHSLSPVLINIVAQHLSQVLPKGDKFSIVATDLIDAEFIQDALAWGYELTYQGLSYRRRFVHSLILSCLTSCALMMALNYQVAVGLGLIGMMAMVRF